MFALNFPGIDEIVKWPALFGDGFYAFNKIALISLIAVLIPVILFSLANAHGKKSLVPNTVSNIAESSVEFIDKQVARQAIGHLADSERVFSYRALRFALGCDCPGE